jgi:LPXTG-motif cell wall-anchored protein
LLLLLPVAVICLGFLFGPGAGAAPAQAADPCAIDQFISGGQVDLTAYAACVAGQSQTAGTGLPRTGSDVGGYVGIGLGLVGLGAAFVWGSRRSREHATS